MTPTEQDKELQEWLVEHTALIEEIGGAVWRELEVETFMYHLRELITAEKLKLLDELDKSMPTVEQLTTKYGYHMPEKQYGYKLALHDIREVLNKLEAEL